MPKDTKPSSAQGKQSAETSQLAVYTAKVVRISSSKNDRGSYCYSVIQHDLPDNAKLYGKDGRQNFYSTKLKGEVGQEITVKVRCIDTTASDGTIFGNVVFAKSEAEIKEEENLDKKFSAAIKVARLAGVKRPKAGEMLFGRYLDTLFEPQVQAEAEEEA